MSDALFTPDFKLEPYWWDAVPRPDLGRPALPAKADVAVIGSGYTGLCAALETARAGRRTVVLDAEDAGWGCSSRNGGQISTSIKPGFDELSAKHGKERAFRIVKEGQNALAWIADFIRSEAMDCHFKVAGRFHAAHSPRQYQALAERVGRQPAGLEVEAHMVPRDEQHGELGSEAYFGGVVFPQHAALDPARYHQGLLERVSRTGAAVVGQSPVTRIAREGPRIRLCDRDFGDAPGFRLTVLESDAEGVAARLREATAGRARVDPA